jgi:hypothetical protein
MARLISLGLFVLLSASTLSSQTPTGRPAVALEPIAGILDAFKTHQIVAIAEGTTHGDEQAAAFRLSLISDPRFAATVNDIVVETANARYQEQMDRFVRGENVPYESLRRVWEDTTQAQVWGWPHNEIPELYRTIRTLNAKLPRERQLRVLLGDPPIEWENVKSAADYRKWLELRDSYPAEVIQREVLSKQRRALVVYGGGHLQRKQILANYDMQQPVAQTVLSLVLQKAPGSVFSIMYADIEPLQPDVMSWQRPSLVILRGTSLGATDFAVYSPTSARFGLSGGKFIPIPREQWLAFPAEDQFDALMYSGPRSTTTVAKPSSAFCADVDSVTTRLARIALAGPPSEATRLKEFCAGVSAPGKP